MSSEFRAPDNHSGAVLAFSLLLLLALTLFALGMSQAGRSQEHAAAAMQERDSAFQLAEAALRNAERLIEAAPLDCIPGGCPAFLEETAGFPSLKSSAWWRQYGQPYQSSAKANGVSILQAWFVVEEIADIPDSLAVAAYGSPSARIYYRITSAVLSDASVPRVVLQSTFVRSTQ
jgi:type IV pilus assembly protein PilX